MHITCTGGRDYKNEERVITILNILEPEFIHVGDCPTGADLFVRNWCDKNMRSALWADDYFKVYEALWDKHGRAAGPIRNKLMINDPSNESKILLAFPGDRGTNNCIGHAKEKGMIVLRVEA